MLVPMRAILEAAEIHGYGQGAFNINAVAQIKAAVEIHEIFRSPAILQGAELANGFMGGRVDFSNSTLEDKARGAANICQAVQQWAGNSPIPVALHLDHGRDLDNVKAAIAGGYTSVMIDGSSLPFEDNVALTREAVRYAHAFGVTVEGELGVLAGVEDHVTSGYSTYTNPMKAVEFFRKTKVDCLAVSYGTKHGANKGSDVKLRCEIPLAIKECMLHEGVEGILVSHGSSSVPGYIVDELNALGGQVSGAEGICREELHRAIQCGIRKINVDTDIRLAVTRNLRELFVQHPQLRETEKGREIYNRLNVYKDQIDPRIFLTPMMDTIMYGILPDETSQAVNDCMEWAVKEIVGTLLVEFGSVGRAPLVAPMTLEQMAEYYRKVGL